MLLITQTVFPEIARSEGKLGGKLKLPRVEDGSRFPKIATGTASALTRAECLLITRLSGMKCSISIWRRRRNSVGLLPRVTNPPKPVYTAATYYGPSFDVNISLHALILSAIDMSLCHRIVACFYVVSACNKLTSTQEADIVYGRATGTLVRNNDRHSVRVSKSRSLYSRIATRARIGPVGEMTRVRQTIGPSPASPTSKFQEDQEQHGLAYSLGNPQ